MNERPVIGTMKELLSAINARREALNLSMDKLDEIALLPERYSIKVLGPNPTRGLGYMSLGALMGALGMGLQVVDDPRTIAMVAKDWEPRKRVMPAVSMNGHAQEMPVNIDLLITERLRARMREIGIKGNKSSVRRANEMKRRAMQRKASHAARMRWSKQ